MELNRQQLVILEYLMAKYNLRFVSPKQEPSWPSDGTRFEVINNEDGSNLIIDRERIAKVDFT